VSNDEKFNKYLNNPKYKAVISERILMYFIIDNLYAILLGFLLPIGSMQLSRIYFFKFYTDLRALGKGGFRRSFKARYRNQTLSVQEQVHVRYQMQVLSPGARSPAKGAQDDDAQRSS
jgi:hypothetical protein